MTRPSSSSSGHLGEHLRAEEFLLLRAGFAGQDAAEQQFGIRRGEIGSLRSGMAVIGGCATERAEAGAGLAECVEVAGP